MVWFLFICFWGCWSCLPRGSLQLLSWAGGWRSWLLSKVLGAWRLIGNTMRDSAQKRHWSDCQISLSHHAASRRARNISCQGASHSFSCCIISRHLPPSVYTYLPQEKVKSLIKDHWSYWAFSHSWSIPRWAVPHMPSAPQPKGKRVNLSLRQKFSSLSTSSILTRTVRIINLHFIHKTSLRHHHVNSNTAMWAHVVRSKFTMTSPGKVYGIASVCLGMVLQAKCLALCQMAKLITMVIKE